MIRKIAKHVSNVSRDLCHIHSPSVCFVVFVCSRRIFLQDATKYDGKREGGANCSSLLNVRAQI